MNTHCCTPDISHLDFIARTLRFFSVRNLSTKHSSNLLIFSSISSSNTSSVFSSLEMFRSPSKASNYSLFSIAEIASHKSKVTTSHRYMERNFNMTICYGYFYLFSRMLNIFFFSVHMLAHIATTHYYCQVK